MPRPRVSIAAVMGFVLVTALGFAALRNANPAWAGLTVLATFGLLALAVLGAIYRRDRKRAFWLGFALFGFGYAMLARELILATPVDTSFKVTTDQPTVPLLTSLILERIEPAIGPERGAAPFNSILDFMFGKPKDRAIRRALEQVVQMPFAQTTPLSDIIKYVQSETVSPPDLPNGIPIYIDPGGLAEAEKTIESGIQLNLLGQPLRVSLRLALKQLDLTYEVKDELLTITYVGNRDEENAQAFTRIGHCLFALLFGLMGSIIAVVLCATRD